MHQKSLAVVSARAKPAHDQRLVQRYAKSADVVSADETRESRARLKANW
jgi:hypothetical protein